MPPIESVEIPRGAALLRDPAFNKGTAFTLAERDALGLHGLLPPAVDTIEQQAERAMWNCRRKSSALEKYIFLSALQDRNETLFCRVLLDNLEELMPIVYTPTVGEACERYGHILRRPRGIYVSRQDRGRISRVLGNWESKNVRVIVCTDGERILGLGDLGVHGMGIPVGKLALYTACAGIAPRQCLPVCIDVGTDNPSLLQDPLYLGLREKRLRGEGYFELMEEFVAAVQERFPDALLQFEDFATENAFALLSRYRDRLRTFDDDIQGTASVAVAGILSALRLTRRPLAEQQLVFLGAGEAGTGIADLFVSLLVEGGMAEAEARRHCWLLDSKGLVVASRANLAAHKRRYAHEAPEARDLLGAVERLRPTALIGVSGAPGTFTQPVIEAMARQQERPIVFALSNPTSKAECTAEQAYRWSHGRAIFASGSPFPEFTLEGRRLVPGQGNNAYVFPGVGLGVMVSGARRVTDEMFAAAARALAGLVGPADLEVGRVYPALSRIREVSREIAAVVAEVAWRRGLAARARPADVRALIEAEMFQPVYPEYA